MCYNLSFSRLTVLKAPFLLVAYVNSYIVNHLVKKSTFYSKKKHAIYFLAYKKVYLSISRKKKKEVENDKLNYKKNGKI